MQTGHQTAPSFSANDLAAAMQKPFSVTAVTFTPAVTTFRWGSIEYLISENKVQFHVWSSGESFPLDMGDRLLRAFSAYEQTGLTVEFIPEVQSWYVELRNLLMQPSAEQIERLLSRI